MAQYRGTVQENRGKVSRDGTRTSGLITSCNGEHVGIDVWVHCVNGEDRFEVSIHGGSSGGVPDRTIAYISGSTVKLFGPNGRKVAEWDLKEGN